MKFLVVLSLLTLSISAALSAPMIQSVSKKSIQSMNISKIGTKIDLPELLEILRPVMDNTDAAYFQALEDILAALANNPLQAEAETLVVTAHHAYDSVVSEAVLEAISVPRDDYLSLVQRVLYEIIPLVSSAVADVQRLVSNEPTELRRAIDTILTKFAGDVATAIQPLLDLISEFQ